MASTTRPPSSDLIEARRYRITAVLGKGGFGKVYRAVMEGAGGFTKDVAIKLLRDEDVPELSLQRFRDEARILGLIRDRAIVTVDPPTRLAGKWAVVMEYVDGATVQRLMKLGPMPATVVAEIVQEVARALDKVFRAPGPEGEPLRLLHRDIKPANLQITQDGEVKILDFGIARADFAHREAVTQAYVGGTRGYIAPERLDGREGPEGDVYSLGVTAHYMLTATRPTRRQLLGLEEIDTSVMDDDTRAMVDLATRMRSVNIDERPTAREVEEICGSVRRTSSGPTLRRWAEQHVPRAVGTQTDEMVGSVLTETLAAVPSDDRLSGLNDFEPSEGPHTGGAPSRLPWLIAALSVILLLGGIAFVSFGGVAGLGYWLASREGSPPIDVAPVPALPAPPPPAPVAQPPAPAPVDATPQPAGAASPEPAPEAPEPAPVKPGEVTPPKPPEPKVAKPRPAPPSPAPTPDAAATFEVDFASVPPGADVLVNGKKIGSTPIFNVQLAPGSYRVEMVGDEESAVHTIDVGQRSPVKWIWRGSDSWSAVY